MVKYFTEKYTELGCFRTAIGEELRRRFEKKKAYQKD